MKRSTGIILALLLLGFTLRVWNLSAPSIWWDEAFTWQTSSHGFANFWQMLLTGDRNPPLYFVSVALWGSVAGWSEFSLRFVSVAWSMVGLAFLFNLAKRLYNTSAGLWTLALAAVAPALVVYAQEARMYAAFFALTAATVYFGFRIFDFGLGKRSAVWLFLGCEAALLLTHYFAVPLVLAINLCALLILMRRRAKVASYAKWIGGQVLAALPIAIWTLIVFTTPGALIKAQETPPDILAFLDQVIMLWLSGMRDLQDEWLALPWLALLILPVALIGAWLVNRRNTLWIVTFVAASLATAYLMTLLLTSFHPRYVLPYSVPLFVMVGAALSNLSAPSLANGQRSRGRRRLIGAATASLLLLALVASVQVTTAPSFAKDDARSVAAYLKQNATADDVILQEANDYTLNYYDHGSAQTRMITATNEIDALAQLNAALGTAHRVWLPHWNVSTQDPRGYWPFLLEQSGRLIDWKPLHGYNVYGYEMAGPLLAPPLDRVMAPAGTVTRWSGIDGQGRDDALTFAVEWQPPVKLYDATGVSIRLIDALGETISSVDHPLLDEQGRTTDHWLAQQSTINYYVLPVPFGTPPLTYTLTAQLYSGREVLAEQVLGTLQWPRHLSDDDPYATLGGIRNEIGVVKEIVPGLMLRSIVVDRAAVRAGKPNEVILYWLKLTDVAPIAPHLRLVQSNRVWAETASWLFEQAYPIGQWKNGEYVTEHRQLIYPPVRGPIDLQIGQGDQWTTLTTLQLDESQLMFDPPAMQHAQAAQFGDFVELVGYDLKSDSLSSTRPLDLKLYWRATNTEPITTSYTVFTQILAPDGHLVAQDDAPPDLPTTQWVPGQIVPDRHAIKVIDPAYRGPATLIVGWYNSATIERVPVNSGGDYVTLSVPVRVEEK